jgi:electron transfer flavoprotein-quinone oxidoreductase
VAERFDVVVVGAGPAGAAAALTLARSGRSVCLVERGPYPGAKNVYGGVIYGRILDRLIPRWWDEMPVQRWIGRRSTMLLTETGSLNVEVRSADWVSPPYNGATAYRSEFDSWLAGKAVEAGARLVTSTTVTGLRRSDDGRVDGVLTDRPDGELEAGLVIACDGVNSFLAKEAGLYPDFDPGHFTLGVKEVLHLGREEIDRRFGVRGREGVDIEVLGHTGGVAGGGFLYTNLDTVSVGLVLSVRDLAAAGRRPEDLLAAFKAHPGLEPLVDGTRLEEYSAHLIPEGGYEAMPDLAADGLLVAGDAAGLCLAAGIFLEGVNFAIGSGLAAGETAVEALAAGNTSCAALAGYRRRLEKSFVLADHRRLRRIPHLLMSERVQRRYPAAAVATAREFFTVRNPQPKLGLLRVLRRELRRQGVRYRDVARDAYHASRSVL